MADYFAGLGRPRVYLTEGVYRGGLKPRTAAGPRPLAGAGGGRTFASCDPFTRSPDSSRAAPWPAEVLSAVKRIDNTTKAIKPRRHRRRGCGPELPGVRQKGTEAKEGKAGRK